MYGVRNCPWPLVGALALVGLVGARQSQAEDSPDPGRIVGVQPPSGARVPSNIVLHFAASGLSPGTRAIQVEVTQAIGGPDNLQANLVDCYDRECVFAVDLPTLTTGPVDLVIGPELRSPRTVEWDVGSEIDATPPTAGMPQIALEPVSNYQPGAEGYLLTITAPDLADDTAVAAVVFDANGASAGSPTNIASAGSLLPGDTDPEIQVFLPPDRTDACVRVMATDWSGNQVTSEVVCESLGPQSPQDLLNEILALVTNCSCISATQSDVSTGAAAGIILAVGLLRRERKGQRSGKG